jgi:hypothetical protein
MSEFRHDYTRNYTIPSHPLATYALTRQTQQFSVKEMEIKEVVNKRMVFPPPRFCLLLFIIIGQYIINLFLIFLTN